MTKQPLGQPARALLQSVTIVVVLGLLALPPIAVVGSGTASADALWTALRIAALEAFTLIFLGIVTGSFRSFFNRLTKPRRVQYLHTAVGVGGFSVAAAHGICAFVFGIAGYRPGAVWVGPAALALLAAVIVTALLRTRLKRYWRWVHRLNYVIFAAILVHGLMLGTDLLSALALKVFVGICAVVVLAGLVKRTLELVVGKR